MRFTGPNSKAVTQSKSPDFCLGFLIAGDYRVDEAAVLATPTQRIRLTW